MNHGYEALLALPIVKMDHQAPHTSKVWSEDEREFFEERAALREYHGLQRRSMAELGALADLLRRRERDEQQIL